MRHTPLLDRCKIIVKDTVPDDFVNMLDAALRAVESTINWGAYEGKRRKPCTEQPLLLAGQPIGQYHCPMCGEMQLAGMAHLPPDHDYEAACGRPWPAGYWDDEGVDVIDAEVVE